jgi:subtilisin family serine protease
MLLVMGLFITLAFGLLTDSLGAALPRAQGQEMIISSTEELPAEAQAYTGPSMPASQADTPRLDTRLAEVAVAARISVREALKLAETFSLRQQDGRIQVQLVTAPHRSRQAQEKFRSLGGEISGVGRQGSLIQGWLPVQSLETAAAQEEFDLLKTPQRAILLETDLGAYTTEGLSLINAPAWHAAGYKGYGVKIALIDGGFEGYSALLGSDLPSSVSVKNFVDGENDGQVNGTTSHGTACAEIIYDIAPQAQLYLVKIETDLDFEEAVEWVKANGVDVISTSIGWLNATPGDGTGYLAEIVESAYHYGIFWATAAGNHRQNHWGGAANIGQGGYHYYNSQQNVNYFGPGDGYAYFIQPGYTFCVFMRWDDWTLVNQDYELYLLRWSGSEWKIKASSQDDQTGQPGQAPAEAACLTTTGDPTAYGYLIKRTKSNRAVNLEVFISQNFPRMDEIVNQRSLVNLADAPRAFTAAALDFHSPYPQEVFSSEGPTNGPGGTADGGFLKPDIAAFDRVSTVSGGQEGFWGTSAAAPHVAGAAALVRFAYPSMEVSQVQYFLSDRALDMGIGGKDNVYGEGRLYLGTPPTNQPPQLDELPGQVLPVNRTKQKAIDLWAYARDAETPLAELAFSIVNAPDPKAGVSIGANRYIHLNPQPGWKGQVLVTVEVKDRIGAVDTSSFQLSVTDFKTWTGSSSQDWHTAANWSPSGVPLAADNVLIPQAALEPVISTADGLANHLFLDPGAVLDLTSRKLFIEGSLVNMGSLKQTLTVSPGITTAFLRITNQAGSSARYFGLDLTPASSINGDQEAVNAAVTVTVSGSQASCQGRLAAIQRCYQVQPSASLQADVRFYFTEAERNDHLLNSSMKVMRYGADWLKEDGPFLYGGSGDAWYIQASGLDQFGEFALYSFSFIPFLAQNPLSPPEAPVLEPLDSPNLSGDYTLYWNQVAHAASYTLEEDSSSQFTNPVAVYSGPNLSWQAIGKPDGTYCYRVRSANSLFPSPWSAPQCVTVQIKTLP